MGEVTIPTLSALPAKPKRIIMHWTGGGPRASEFERAHYHYLFQQDGRVVAGVPVARNMRKVVEGVPYAAHTRGLNSFSVGVSFCGMLDAVQGGSFGPHPLTQTQVQTGLLFIAELCREWRLPANEDTLFTHAEAERLHGVKQEHKWDIDALPFMRDASPAEIGNWMRMTVGHAL